MKSNIAEEDLSELKSDMEAARMNLILTNNRVKKNSENIKEMQDIIDSLKSGAPMPVAATPEQKEIKLPPGGNIDVNQL